MKDFYAILGLDRDASLESIKVAYRRLAREAHPDRARHRGPEAEQAASGRMAELNEAYQTLSDVIRRKDYDEELRAASEGKAPVLTPPPVPEPEPETPTPIRARTRAPSSADMISNVVRQFSQDMLSNLVNNKKTFQWKQHRFEGFDWGLNAGFWLEEYNVLLRGFSTADPAAAQKFINYSNLAIEKSRRMFKRNIYLFLLIFQRLNDPEAVKAAARRFAGSTGTGPLSGVRAQVVLLDITHGRSLPCGPAIRDKRFDALMRSLGFSRPA